MDDTRGPIYRQSLNQTEETSFVQEFDVFLLFKGFYLIKHI